MRLSAALFTHPAGVARRPLHEAARSAYASTLGDARREEKKRLRRADVATAWQLHGNCMARRARAEAEGLGQACLAATSGAQPGFPQGGGTKAEGTGNKGWGLRRPWHPGSRVRSGGVKAPQGTQVPRRQEKGPPKNSKTPRNQEERREDPPGPPDPCTAFSVYQQHQGPSSEEQQQAQRSSRTTRSWFGTMEYPVCHICRLMLNGERQYLDHLEGRLHRRNRKKAKRGQMELKLTVEPDDKAPPKGQPVATLAQKSDNGSDIMSRDVSIEGF